MTVEYVTGDLFDPALEFDAIGHGVNCKGLMGSGIAVPFRNKYPIMYHKYKRMCDENFLRPGMVMVYSPSPDFTIYNIASQYNPGPDAKIEFLAAGLRYVRFHMEYKNIRHLGLPRIGAGIGGLTFMDVSGTIETVFKGSVRKVTVVSL